MQASEPEDRVISHFPDWGQSPTFDGFVLYEVKVQSEVQKHAKMHILGHKISNISQGYAPGSLNWGVGLSPLWAPSVNLGLHLRGFRPFPKPHPTLQLPVKFIPKTPNLHPYPPTPLLAYPTLFKDNMTNDLVQKSFRLPKTNYN